MPKIDPTNCTLIELAYARTGSMLKAARVVGFVTAWGVCRRELGHEPSIDEYAAYWREPRSTAFKHRGEFREVFPDLQNPGPVLEVMASSSAAPVDFSELPAVA